MKRIKRFLRLYVGSTTFRVLVVMVVFILYYLYKIYIKPASFWFLIIFSL